MEKKILAERYYAGTIYGDIEYSELISILEKAKRDVELLYPEVLTNGHKMRVEFDTDTEYGDIDIDVNITYVRHETDAECKARIESELKVKAANTMELRKKIDANKEEAIAYLKSIGAI